LDPLRCANWTPFCTHGQILSVPRAYEAMTDRTWIRCVTIAFVTGGAGRVGTAITKALQDAGHRNSRPRRDADKRLRPGVRASKPGPPPPRCSSVTGSAALVRPLRRRFDHVTQRWSDAATCLATCPGRQCSTLHCGSFQAFVHPPAWRNGASPHLIITPTRSGPRQPRAARLCASKGALLGVMRTPWPSTPPAPPANSPCPPLHPA